MIRPEKRHIWLAGALSGRIASGVPVLFVFLAVTSASVGPSKASQTAEGSRDQPPTSREFHLSIPESDVSAEAEKLAERRGDQLHEELKFSTSDGLYSRMEWNYDSEKRAGGFSFEEGLTGWRIEFEFKDIVLGGPPRIQTAQQFRQLKDSGAIWAEHRLLLSGGFEAFWSETSERGEEFAHEDLLEYLSEADRAEIGEVPSTIPLIVLRMRMLFSQEKERLSPFSDPHIGGEFLDLVLAAEARSRGKTIGSLTPQ